LLVPLSDCPQDDESARDAAVVKLRWCCWMVLALPDAGAAGGDGGDDRSG
jgi:hypothetical protein